MRMLPSSPIERSSWPAWLISREGRRPGCRLGAGPGGVEPAQELGNGADLGDALVEGGLLVARSRCYKGPRR